MGRQRADLAYRIEVVAGDDGVSVPSSSSRITFSAAPDVVEGDAGSSEGRLRLVGNTHLDLGPLRPRLGSRRTGSRAGRSRQPRLRAGVLDQDAHERVEQAVEDDLARDGLGGLEHRADGRARRWRVRGLGQRRAAEDLAGDEVGVRAFEAPHRLRSRPIGRTPCAPR